MLLEEIYDDGELPLLPIGDISVAHMKAEASFESEFPFTADTTSSESTWTYSSICIHLLPLIYACF